ncbi:MAG: hypothetical protein ACRC1K_22490 [Planctomycetia bacterium]
MAVQGEEVEAVAAPVGRPADPGLPQNEAELGEVGVFELVHGSSLG